MLAKLKGWKRRISTLKKDKKYKAIETDFGEFKVLFMNSVFINDNMSNILIKIIYNTTNSDIISDINQLQNMLQSVGCRYYQYYNKDTAILYIAGSAINYAGLVMYYIEQPEYTYNKPFRAVYNTVKQINIVDRRLPVNNDEDSSDDDYECYPYESDYITISSRNSIFVQQVELDEDDCDISNLFPLLILVIVYKKENGSFSVQYDYILDFITKYNLNALDDTDEIDKMRNMFYANFEINNFKNIFDINFKVMNQDDSDIYKDIDEILD